MKPTPSHETLLKFGQDHLFQTYRQPPVVMVRGEGPFLFDAEGRELAAWGKSHDREPGYVYITHPHADHFLGLPEILAAFPEARPVALAESIPAMEEQISPGYMQVWGGFFPGQLTAKPVAPAPLAGTTIPVGGSTVSVIPVGTTDTGHSSVVHVPGLSLVVSGDVVYNQTHMWLSGSTPASAIRPANTEM